MITVERPLFYYYNKMAKTLYPHVPFTYYWYLLWLVGKEGNSLIDFGCGWGDPVEVLQNNKRRYAVGVDIFKKYLTLVKKKRIYNELINADISKYRKKKKYDIVMCSHVLEHLSKKNGERMLNYFETIATQKIVLAMPVGELPQSEYDNNKYQNHLSSWLPRELSKKGYKIYGFSPKFIYGNENIIKNLGLVGFLVFIVSFILEPFFVSKPDKCVYMLAVKEIK